MQQALRLLSKLQRFEGVFDQMLEGLDVVTDGAAILLDRPILLVYPLLGGLFGSLWFALGLGVLGGLVWTLSIPWWGIALLTLFTLLGTYYAFAFTNVLFASALIHEVRNYHEGVPLDLATGLRAALGNWSTLFVWTLISWTIGAWVQLKTRNSSGVVGTVIDEGIQMTWDAATFFVVPVILFEDANWRTAPGKAAGRITDNWGEILGAVIGLRIAAYAISIVGGGITSVISYTLFFDAFGILAFLFSLPVVVAGVLLNLTLQGVVKGTMYDEVADDEGADEDLSYRDLLSGDGVPQQPA